MRFLRRTDAPHTWRRLYSHHQGTAQRQGGDWVARLAAHRYGGFPELRPGGDEQGAQVQRSHQRGSDEHLLRFVLGCRVVFYQECGAEQASRRTGVLAVRGFCWWDTVTYHVWGCGLALAGFLSQGDCGSGLVCLACRSSVTT